MRADLRLRVRRRAIRERIGPLGTLAGSVGIACYPAGIALDERGEAEHGWPLVRLASNWPAGKLGLGLGTAAFIVSLLPPWVLVL